MDVNQIQIWLADAKAWGQIFGGLSKIFSNDDVLSTAWNFAKPGDSGDSQLSSGAANFLKGLGEIFGFVKSDVVKPN